MRCPRCQAENPDNARFCEECGARLALTCPHCGAEVSPGKKFCRSCGGAVGGSQPHATLDLPRRTRVAGATQVAGATFTAGVRTGILGTVLLGLLAVSAGIARLALLGWLLGRVLA
jgi:ribosomal protein L40E